MGKTETVINQAVDNSIVRDTWLALLTSIDSRGPKSIISDTVHRYRPIVCIALEINPSQTHPSN
jgi:hypothetical protein